MNVWKGWPLYANLFKDSMHENEIFSAVLSDTSNSAYMPSQSQAKGLLPINHYK